MDSSATLTSHARLVSKESDIIFPASIYPSSRRTPSFSSSSSLSPSSSSFDSSYFPDDSPLNPSIPLRYSGVPFSWEQLPGIPKKQVLKKKEPLSKLNLPLPPPTTSTSKKFNSEEYSGERKKNSRQSTLQRDPFFAALVECSKDDDHEELSNGCIWNQAKVSRSLSDRFGFINLYASCKRTSAISESIVYLPRSSRHSFDLIYHRSR
ncbi:uncharacterized protein LOC121260544 [Juglans microcarpa x Juglans regia]|uniref:uncharacterized protein LOC121260544 n=1 Tax=Juglans microcarpa x Juglans regia TaxID=2249226 RepID=UPI001B7DAE20|nr:uncharacterized protein LOC121260544 [Juglans microcarpa x Juglans regia]